MTLDASALTLAYRRGQIDALVAMHLAPSGLYTPEMVHSLALRQLTRAWDRYREDRGITLGARLVGGECAAERNAFLALLVRCLPSPTSPLAEAVRTVRRIAVAPLAAEVRQSVEVEAAGISQLDAVIATLAADRLPTDPVERLLAIVNHHRYSLGEGHGSLDATAHSPCWAINLLAATRPDAFGLSASPLSAFPLPFPAVIRRRLFRADLSANARRTAVNDGLLDALKETTRDIDRVWRASQRFAAAFPQQRSHSRLGSAWLLLVGLNDLTPSQLARALPATKAGAGKLLRQLATGNLARANGPFEPFTCSLMRTTAFDSAPY